MQASPRLGSVGLPVHPDHVRAGGVGDLFQRPACTRRKGDHRRTGLPRDPRGLRQIGQREGPGMFDRHVGQDAVAQIGDVSGGAEGG